MVEPIPTRRNRSRYRLSRAESVAPPRCVWYENGKLGILQELASCFVDLLVVSGIGTDKLDTNQMTWSLKLVFLRLCSFRHISLVEFVYIVINLKWRFLYRFSIFSKAVPFSRNYSGTLVSKSKIVSDTAPSPIIVCTAFLSALSCLPASVGQCNGSTINRLCRWGLPGYLHVRLWVTVLEVW